MFMWLFEASCGPSSGKGTQDEEVEEQEKEEQKRDEKDFSRQEIVEDGSSWPQ